MAAKVSDILAMGIAGGSADEHALSDGSCEVTVFDGADAVERAAIAWQAIESAGVVKSPFQSLTVARATAKAHVANGEIPRIVMVHDGNRPAVIFPTVVGTLMGIPSIRFLGEPFVQYGDLIAGPDATPAQLSAALAAAIDDRIANVAFFRRVRVDAAIAPILAQHAGVVCDDGAPVVALHGGKKTSSHHERELRRLRRRLSAQGDVTFEVLEGAAAREVLGESLEFKRAWLIERGLPSSLFDQRSWEGVILDLADGRCGTSNMMVARVAAGGATAATEIGFVSRDTWFAYMGALAPDLARFGPGHILMEELMAWCRARGLKAYDLLPPIQPYKMALTQQVVPVRDYAISLGIAGLPAIFAARMIPMAKRFATATPLAWRRWIVRRRLQAAAKS